MDNNENNYQNSEYNNQQMNNNNIEDSGSFGYAVLGFFIPLVGLILFLVWNKNKPKSAKKAGIGALVGLISSIVLSVASIFLATGLIFSNFGGEFSACKEKYGEYYTGVSIKNGVTYCVNYKTKEEKRLDSIENEPNNIIDNTPSEDETNLQTEDETQQPAQPTNNQQSSNSTLQYERKKVNYKHIEEDGTEHEEEELEKVFVNGKDVIPSSEAFQYSSEIDGVKLLQNDELLVDYCGEWHCGYFLIYNDGKSYVNINKYFESLNKDMDVFGGAIQSIDFKTDEVHYEVGRLMDLDGTIIDDCETYKELPKVIRRIAHIEYLGNGKFGKNKITYEETVQDFINEHNIDCKLN